MAEPPLDERIRERLRKNEPGYISALGTYYRTFGGKRPVSLEDAAKLWRADPGLIETYLAACPARLGIPKTQLEAHAFLQNLCAYDKDRFPDGHPPREPEPMSEHTIDVVRRHEPLFIRALELYYGGDHHYGYVGKGGWISCFGAVRRFGGMAAYIVSYMAYCPARVGEPCTKEEAREYWTTLRAYRVETFPHGLPMPDLPPLHRKTKFILTTYEPKFIAALESLYSTFGNPRGSTFNSAARRSGVSPRFLLDYLVRFNDRFNIPFDEEEAKVFLANLQRHREERSGGRPHPRL